MFSEQTLRGQTGNGLSKNTLLDDPFSARHLLGSFGALWVLPSLQTLVKKVRRFWNFPATSERQPKSTEKMHKPCNEFHDEAYAIKFTFTSPMFAKLRMKRRTHKLPAFSFSAPDLAQQNRTITIASNFHVNGDRSQESLQQEWVLGLKIAARNREPLAPFHPTLKSQCSTTLSCFRNC